MGGRWQQVAAGGSGSGSGSHDSYWKTFLNEFRPSSPLPTFSSLFQGFSVPSMFPF